MSVPPERAEENRIRCPVPAVSISGPAGTLAAGSDSSASVSGAIGLSALLHAATARDRARTAAFMTAGCDWRAMVSSWDWVPIRLARAGSFVATGDGAQPSPGAHVGITEKSPEVAILANSVCARQLQPRLPASRRCI